MPDKAKQVTKSVNLALQGGGAHGAFTWGVLDRILEDPRLEIDSITGASAGAMNAVVLAEGLSKGGKEGARAHLAEFWGRVGEAAKKSPIQRTFFDKWAGNWSLDNSPSYIMLDIMSRITSPYELNPLDMNPLRDILNDMVDFETVCKCDKMPLFISATNVETGMIKVFQKHELTVDHIMASACLPHMFKAVCIDDVPYWDGGYSGNPPLFPLFDHAQSDDVIIVQINPITRPGEPRKARDILNRMNEITFNASLMRELRSVDFVTRLMEAGRLEGTGYRRVNAHMIGDEASLAKLESSSKMNAETAFLDMLFEKGRAAGDSWLEAHFKDIGKRTTIDFKAMFGGGRDPLDGARITRKAKYEKTKR